MSIPKWGDIERAWTPEDYGDQRDTVVLGFGITTIRWIAVSNIYETTFGWFY
jgi:hypothetical protein